MWIFDQIDRIDELIDRVVRRMTVLGRQRCDTPRGSDARAAIALRILALAVRLHRLRQAARVVRRDASVMEDA